MPVVEGRSSAEWMRNRWSAQGDLQRGATGPNDGRWQPVEGLWPLTIVVGGDFDPNGPMVADLLVCNQRARPSDDDNGWPSIYTFTERRVFTIQQPIWWIKLRITSFEPMTGSLTANYQAAGMSG